MIFDYNLYIFDLDGTIIDSEYSHYEAYNLQLTTKLTFEEYEMIFHDDKRKDKFITENNICKIKKESDFVIIYKNNAKLIEGFFVFFEELLENGKDIIIVTNSSEKRMSFILENHPFLNNVNKIITKNSMTKCKPNPECYINAINNSKYNINDIIIFEDSYTGYKSLEHIDVEKVFICKNMYYYYDKIPSQKYDNYIDIDKKFKPIYNIKLNKTFLKYNNNYINSLSNNMNNLFKIHTLFKCLLERALTECDSERLESVNDSRMILNRNQKTFFFVGVGKSNIIAQKCSSTWRSLGINTHALNCEDIWHGGFGTIKNDSIIIYLSNSGNTVEIINIANHLKNHFSITQIALTCNSKNTINKYVDYTFNLIDNLEENGIIKKAPSISSFIFMTFLDTLGIIMTDYYLTSNIFTLYHPGGTLGKSNKLDYVIISCCGKGTRLKPLTEHIPKSLVNIGNDNILTKQIKYWMKYTDNFIIISEKKYNDIINFYFKMYSVQFSIKNVEINNNEENAYTLQQGTNINDIINKRVIITWCDIILTDEIDLNKLNNNLIFTYGNESRYYCEKNAIYKKEEGNVIGCFYINKMTLIVNNNNKNDICDVFIENFGEFDTYQLNNLIDVGDMDKLDNYFISNNINYKTRYFNKIEDFESDKLIKSSTNRIGKDIIEREIKYYKYISKFELNFPKIFANGEDFFIMEKKYEYFNVNKLLLNDDILKIIFIKLNIIHNCKIKIVDKITYESDIKNEFYDKILSRLNEVTSLINFIKPEKVNDIFINQHNIQDIVYDLYVKINDKLNGKYTYHLIHGDCQFSNTLYNFKNNDICFIDPRGYFGKTLFFGIKEYDYSKVLYALSGYDAFNNEDKYYFTYENNNLNTNINSNDLLKFKHIFEENNIDFELCLYMMAIHWLGLASYNRNNINKCVAAYYQGIFLYDMYCK